MSSEPDCTASSGGSGFLLESTLNNIINHRKSSITNKLNNNNNNDTDCDLDGVHNNSNHNSDSNNNNTNNNGNNTNSSNHAAAATTTSNSLLGDSVSNLDGKFNTLKCDRCDSFETISHALLLVHVAQCRGDANSGSSRQQYAMDVSNNDIGMAEDATQSTMDSTSVAASSTINSDSSSSLNLKQNADGNNGNVAQRKLFECDVCNMKFSNGANMRRHKMRHTGVKPYECRVCQKRFFRKDHLAEHFTTHTKTLPYHCPICNRGFQRQIAMRAHFQNEHVGQNDLVKTCPLCNYRAGTMKSLRIHFFNRHGIDLDNPGPNAPSSLLLALDATNAGSYLPSIALAAAAAAAAANSANNSALSMAANNNSNSVNAYSDSGDSLQDSLRSAENGTPPMHFLTPHVEISMADNDNFKSEPIPASISSALEIQPCPSTMNRPLNGGSPSPHSADSNAPTSSQSLISSALQSSRQSLLHDGQITPSISLIPIKQEPGCDDYDNLSKSSRQQSGDQQSSSSSTSMQNMNSIANNSVESSAPSSSSLTSLIKVSPLKSLLREDLKRRISARASSRASRNSSNANGNGGESVSNGTNSTSNNSTTSSSGTTSTQNSASSISFSKIGSSASSITNTINAISQHLLSNSSITVTTESTTTSSGTYNGTTSRSPLAAVATTSNGAITSTGTSETELLLAAVSSGNRGKRMLQCLFCGIEFPDQTLYFLHKGCHSESNPWKCNICGEQLNNVYEFNSHLLSKSHQ